MRPRRAATALFAVTAGLAASAAVRFVAARTARRALPAPVLVAVPSPAAPAAAAPQRDAVVLPFARPVAVVPPPAPATPARCGDNGGRTKAGAPCAARATGAGRCHHHRAAA